MASRTFRASSTPMTFVMLGVGFAILLLPVIVLILDPPDASFFRLNWMAIFPIGIFGFFMYVMIASSLKMFTSYTVFSGGIKVYIPPFHTRTFRLDQIKEVKLLTANETKKIIEASILEQNSFSESADIIGYLQMIRKRSPAFRYFTIAPTARVSTSGVKETITSLDVKSNGQSITLTMQDNAVFFLTPGDPENFIAAFKSMNPTDRPDNPESII